MDRIDRANMRKVMIGTPCYDGRIDVWYANSLMTTVKMSKEKGVEITPMWVSFDALIQRARNDTVQIALEMGMDDLIWIDSDIEWNPEWFYKLLEYPEDIVGGTYRKKGDIEQYVLRQTKKRPINQQTGLVEVDGLGTGFVKMSRASLQWLWDNSPEYVDPKDGKERRMIFDVVIENGDMVSEDIHMFNTLTRGGFKVYMDTAMTCNHIGPYKFKGDFMKWYNGVEKVKPALPKINKQL